MMLSNVAARHMHFKTLIDMRKISTISSQHHHHQCNVRACEAVLEQIKSDNRSVTKAFHDTGAYTVSNSSHQKLGFVRS